MGETNIYDLDKRVAVLETELKNVKENDIKSIKEEINSLGKSQKDIFDTVIEVKTKLEKQDGLREEFRELKHDFKLKLPEIERKTEHLSSKMTILIAIMGTIGTALISGLIKLFFFSHFGG